MELAHKWIAPDLRGLAWPVDDLNHLPGNPRQGDIGSVARSYAVFGQRKPIVAVRLPDGGSFVEAGNHQLAACRMLADIGGRLIAARFEEDDLSVDRITADFVESFGRLAWSRFSDLVDVALASDGQVPFSKIAVAWVDEDAVTAKAYAIADNRTAELGDNNPDLLLAMLREVQEDGRDLLPATAYDGDDMDDVLARIERQSMPGPQPDPPEVFVEFDDTDVATEHECPECGYEWSGNGG